jgi:uncharacterized protein (UPF0333 family)
MENKHKKAQSVLEYTLLILTVVAAIITMNLYVNRAVNARLRSVELEINPPVIIQR